MELGIYTEGGETKPYTIERQNLLFVGKKQTGKSETLIRLALDDIYNNKNVLFLGNNSTEEILKHIPNERQEETIYFNPVLQPFAFNPLANVSPKKHKALANAFIDTIHTLLTYDGSTPTLDDYLRVSVLTLLEYGLHSPISMYFLLTDKKYRESIPLNVHDDFLKLFWSRFDTLTPKEQRQEVSSTLNKLSVFIFDPVLRNCLVQPENHISLKNPITLVSLDDLELGEDSASFLGALVLASLLAQEPTKTTIYIDDASRYGSRLLGTLLRHPTITVVLAVPSLEVFNNLSDVLKSVEVVPLRTSLEDARVLESNFPLKNFHEPLSRMPLFHAYVVEDDSVRSIQLKKHDHEIPKKPRNTKKPVQKRIIDRCSQQCTLPDKKIKARLGEFFQ